MPTTENEHNALFQNKFITSVKTLMHSPRPHFPDLWLLRATSGARNPNLNIGYKRMRGSYITLH